MIQFYAEKEMVMVIPRIKTFEKICLINADVTIPPLTPSSPVSMPIWVAFALHKNGGCDFIIPEWLEPEYLFELKKRSVELSPNLVELPNEYFFDIAYIFLKHDLLNEASRGLIADLHELRNNIIINNIVELFSTSGEVKLDKMLNLVNYSKCEYEKIRPIMENGYKLLLHHRMPTIFEENEGDDGEPHHSVVVDGNVETYKGAIYTKNNKPLKRLRRFGQ